MIKIFSMDTSTTATGWAVFEDSIYKRSGLIDLRRSRKDAEGRIDEMCRDIIDLLQKEKPDIIVLEKVSVNRNLDTIRKLSRIVDVCYFYSLVKGTIRFHEYSPSEWRAAIGMQKRRAGRKVYKGMATVYAQRHFKKGIEEDEAEAICIGAAYISEYINMNKYRLEKGDFDECED